MVFGIEKHLPPISYGPDGKKIINIDKAFSDFTRDQKNLEEAKKSSDQIKIENAQKSFEESEKIYNQVKDLARKSNAN